MGDSVTANFGSLEIGAKKPSSASFVDFHFLGTNDYDARIVCDQNDSGSNGRGRLTIAAGTINIQAAESISVTGSMTSNGSINATTQVTSKATSDTQNAHLWFYGAGGASRGVIYVGKDGSIRIRPDSNDNGGANGSATSFSPTGVVTCVSVNQTSDERSKFNKEKVKDALEKICDLTGYTYDLQVTNEVSSAGAGILAQDLEKVLPVAVKSSGVGYSPEGKSIDDLKTVDYSAMSALYVEAIKELAERLKVIEKELADLRGPAVA
ncbi:tail fiber domain-containing protein [Enterobacter sichuanensis]|uniref:tail fiber domain-containing protein n=1 Tax=Enterobacter sichuanensis TaxID=2071710 RepID=UPI0036D2387A